MNNSGATNSMEEEMTQQQQMELRLLALETRLAGLPVAQMPALPAAPQAAAPAPKKAKAKKAPRKAKPAALPTTQAVKPDIAPRPQLQVVQGALTPLSDVLRGLKTTSKSVADLEHLLPLEEYLERKVVPLKTGVNGHNIKRAWSTLVHFRINDDTEEGEEPVNAKTELASDLKNFKRWCKEPRFLAVLNNNPDAAVFWFVDVMLASNGDMDMDLDSD